MKCFRYIAILLAVALWATGRACAVHAQALQRDTLTYTVFFRPGIETVYYPYKTNQAALTELRSLLWRDPSAQVSVCMYAAPEGDVFERSELLQTRARILQKWLESSCDVQPSRLDVRWEPDWRLSDEPRAEIRVVVASSEVLEETDDVPLLEFTPALSSVEFSGLGPEPVLVPRTVFAVRTNVLAVPFANMGAEISLSTHWSLGVDLYYPWLRRPHSSEGTDYTGKCVQILAGAIEPRYWFGGRDRLLGFAIGMHATAGYYDLEWNYHGYQGEFVSAGLDFVYACPVFKDKLRLEFSLGLGYLYSRAREYRTYGAGGQAFTEKDMAKDIHFVGPVKGGVSLVLPIRVKKPK
ncbi:MAG: DUF3575 domain-containing protein [Bacteroidales bacterium]|nr:DUF3575 domain-containing protein [Bacteroidales bacterium]